MKGCCERDQQTYEEILQQKLWKIDRITVGVVTATSKIKSANAIAALDEHDRKIIHKLTSVAPEILLAGEYQETKNRSAIDLVCSNQTLHLITHLNERWAQRSKLIVLFHYLIANRDTALMYFRCSKTQITNFRLVQKRTNIQWEPWYQLNQIGCLWTLLNYTQIM